METHLYAVTNMQLHYTVQKKIPKKHFSTTFPVIESRRDHSKDRSYEFAFVTHVRVSGNLYA